MAFFHSLIVIMGCFMEQGWMNYYFYPMIGLAFLASVPRIIKTLFIWR